MHFFFLVAVRRLDFSAFLSPPRPSPRNSPSPGEPVFWY